MFYVEISEFRGLHMGRVAVSSIPFNQAVSPVTAYLITDLCVFHVGASLGKGKWKQFYLRCVDLYLHL